ncbi:hypothetical protein [Glutamicibacter sp. NPDC087344]|uniref:hypothetical protein n=1 Tax=Glutamicibacter sp. NPDC087344 TaxID=3363994 RepID=UPI00382FE097
MALFQTLESTTKALADANAAIAEWETKHANAIAELTQLESTAMDEILEDPAKAETHAFKVGTLTAQINVYARAIEAARAKTLGKHRDMLEAEAKDEDKKAAEAEKVVAKHEAKVKTVMDALQELEGAEYRLQLVRDEHGNIDYSFNCEQTTKTQKLQFVADDHKLRAHVIREFLETGKIRDNAYGMGDLPGVGQRFNPAKHVPASVRAAKTAGLGQEVSP